jgi:large subunit ribosomal protein L17
MAGYRKLGRTSSQRKALLRNQVTNLLYHGKIKTTEAKAKEIRSIAEHLITMAVKEKDNYEMVTVKAKVARKDKDGKRVKEVVDGKKVTVFDEVAKQIKKEAASRLHARRQMIKVLYGVEAYLVDDLKESVTNSKGQSLDDTYVVFDIETTGFSAIYDKIIEIGAVKVEKGNITDKFSVFVNPERPIPFRIIISMAAE